MCQSLSYGSLTWANNWNGVNHPATAPTAEAEAVALRGYQWYQRREVLPR